MSYWTRYRTGQDAPCQHQRKGDLRILWERSWRNFWRGKRFLWCRRCGEYIPEPKVKRTRRLLKKQDRIIYDDRDS